MPEYTVTRIMAIFVPLAVLAGYNASPPPPDATLDSGITSSNGGGQRALGNLPDVGVTNRRVTESPQPRDPRMPRY